MFPGGPFHLSAIILDSRLPCQSHRAPALGSESCTVSNSWQVRPTGPRSESLLALQKDPPHLSAVTVTLFTLLHSRKGDISFRRVTAWSYEVQMKWRLLFIRLCVVFLRNGLLSVATFRYSFFHGTWESHLKVVRLTAWLKKVGFGA